MNTKPVQPWDCFTSGFKTLIVVLLALGVFFRFASLSERPYWHDETYTLLRASGHTIAEMTAQVFDGQLHDRSDLLKFQQIAPEKTEIDLIRSLVTEEPHRAPLYYAIAREWMKGFGSDVVTMRSLSALISLLVFPALYWLCIELFAQPLTGWIAIMLMSISPFHVYYAQEVREYSLWTVTILVMSAAFLRAIRLNTKSSWILYSLSITISLYTFILSIPLLVGQALYFLMLQKFRCTQKMRTFLKAFLLGLSFYLPWLSFTLMNLPQVERTSAWMFQPTPIQVLFQHWITSLQFIFILENLAGSLKFVFATAIAILVIFAIRSLIKHTPKPVWIFIALLILPVFLSLALPDLILGGLRSTNGRYFVPSYLGLQLAVAHLLTTQAEPRSSRLQQTYWKFVMVTILVVGVLSCSAQALQNQISKDKAIAAVINRSNTAIVVSNEESNQGGGTIGDILAISHLVRPETRFQLVIQPQVPSIPHQPDLYLFKPLTYLKQQLQQTDSLQAIYQDKLFHILPTQR